MKTTWIETALSRNGSRELIVQQDEAIGGYAARLEFTDLSQFVAAGGRTPLEAMSALELALMEDAAREMVEAGVV